MNYDEASEWLKGIRSMTNIVPDHPRETWLVRVAQADAACTEQAYWIVKAHREGAHDKAACHWTKDVCEDGSVGWETECNKYYGEDRYSGISGFHFCMFCGGEIVK